MSVKVNVDNFKRAESDTYFSKFAQNDVLGKFAHRREPADIDKQDVIRMNRDTLYSSAVVDLGASPATVALPEAAGRFMAMQVIDEDHFTVTVIYGAGAHTFTKEQVGNPLPVISRAHACRSRQSVGRGESACAAGCAQRDTEPQGYVRGPRLGSRLPRQDSQRLECADHG